MKKIKVLAVRSIFLLLLPYTNLASIPTQETRETTILYQVSPNMDIVVKGQNALIEVESWSKNQVEVYALVEFKGDINNRVQEFLDNFEQIVAENIRHTSLTLDVNMDYDHPNKIQIGTKWLGTQIGYDDDEFKITYRLKVPSGNDLDIYNSYDDLFLSGDYDGQVKVEHYSGDLLGGSFESLTLDLKYGGAKLKNVNNADFTLYEQDLEIERIGSGVVSAKYAKMYVDQADELEFDSYESKIRIGNISVITGQFKYGELEIRDQVEKVDLYSIYELDLEIGQVDLVRLQESKYCDFVLTYVGRMEQIESYEDNVDIGTLNELEANSKYSKYDIQQLNSDLELNGYECEVDINNISNTIQSVVLSGKYCKLEIDTNDLPFHLDANIQYGNIHYPNGMERKILIKESSHTEMQLASKGAGKDDLVVKIRGYEIEARIY